MANIRIDQTSGLNASQVNDNDRIIIYPSQGFPRNNPANLPANISIAQFKTVIGTMTAGIADGSINIAKLEQTLQDLINNAATQTDLQTETQERISADSALGDLIENKADQTALDAEITTRGDADTALGTRIDLKADETDLDELMQRVQTLEMSDGDGTPGTPIANITFGQLATALQNRINGKADQSALDDEVSARTDADTALGTRIDGKADQTALDAETTARENADTALGNRIDGKADASALTSETNARTAADTALGTRIDNEVSAREAADTALGDRITDETTNRRNDDNNLLTLFSQEATARTTADTALGTRIDGNAANIATALGKNLTDAQLAMITRILGLIDARTNTATADNATDPWDIRTGFQMGDGETTDSDAYTNDAPASTTTITRQTLGDDSYLRLTNSDLEYFPHRTLVGFTIDSITYGTGAAHQVLVSWRIGDTGTVIEARVDASGNLLFTDGTNTTYASGITTTRVQVSAGDTIVLGFLPSALEGDDSIRVIYTINGLNENDIITDIAEFADGTTGINLDIGVDESATLSNVQAIAHGDDNFILTHGYLANRHRAFDTDFVMGLVSETTTTIERVVIDGLLLPPAGVLVAEHPTGDTDGNIDSYCVGTHAAFDPSSSSGQNVENVAVCRDVEVDSDAGDLTVDQEDVWFFIKLVDRTSGATGLRTLPADFAMIFIDSDGEPIQIDGRDFVTRNDFRLVSGGWVQGGRLGSTYVYSPNGVDTQIDRASGTEFRLRRFKQDVELGELPGEISGANIEGGTIPESALDSAAQTKLNASGGGGGGTARTWRTGKFSVTSGVATIEVPDDTTISNFSRCAILYASTSTTNDITGNTAATNNKLIFEEVPTPILSGTGNVYTQGLGRGANNISLRVTRQTNAGTATSFTCAVVDLNVTTSGGVFSTGHIAGVWWY